MSIVTKSDFVGEVKIANISQPVVQETLQVFINKYEPKYLKQLLGSDFATLFVNGLNADPIEQRWTDLLAEVKPAIVDYIYYWYQRDLVTETTGVGNVKSVSANSTPSSEGGKLARAWNEMALTGWDTSKLLVNAPTTYPEYVRPYWYSYEWYGCFDDYFWFSYYPFYKPRLPEILVPINDYNL